MTSSHASSPHTGMAGASPASGLRQLASLGGQLDFTSKFKMWVPPSLLDRRWLRKDSPNQWQELGFMRMVPWEGGASGDSSKTIMIWINSLFKSKY